MRRIVFAVTLALAPQGASAADPVGRLFYTPAQRAQLDAARNKKSRPAIQEEPQPAAPLPEVVTYDGVVRRSDGRTTVWINSRAINDGRAPAGVPVTGSLRPDGSVNLGIPQSERSVTLKVGQSVEVTSGSIAESYNRTRRDDKAAPKPPASAGQSDAANSPAADARPAPVGRNDIDENGPPPR